MYEELVRTENENNKDYFTRAAAYIKKLKDAGKEDEVSEAMRIVMEWLAPIMMQHIECEIVANDLDENTGVDYSIRVFDVISKDFYKYNCPDFMKEENKDKQFAIKSFIKMRTKYCIGDAIAHNLRLTNAEGKMLHKIRGTRKDLARKYQIEEDDVSVELIYEALNGEIPEDTIVELILREKGHASVEQIEESGGTAGYSEGIDIGQFHTELDEKTRSKLDQYFADITKMEILIFMQDHKLLDDELNDMEIKEFVETDIFRGLFAVDTSIRSRKNPIRTVENKRVKMNTVVYGLKEVIEEDDVNSEGLLTGYFYDFLSRK